MKLRSIICIIFILTLALSVFAGCTKDRKENDSSEPKNPSLNAQAESEKELLETTTEGTDDEGVFCGDYSEVSSQIHLPNQEVDGNYWVTSSDRSGAPLKHEDSATSSAAIASNPSGSTHPTKNTDGYTLTYGCVATRVQEKEHTEKMRSFLKDTCKYWVLVDWVKNPEAICTVEIDGNRYSLVENYMVENLTEGGGAYILNKTELEAFRGILEKSEVLAESVDVSINKVLENIGDTTPLSGTPKDDAE